MEVSFKPGQASKDGIMDNIDMVEVDRTIVKLDSLLLEADVNQNGRINVLDMT